MVIRDFMEYFFILSLIKSQSKTGSKFLAFNYVQVLQHKAGKSLAFPLTLCLYMGCWSIFVRLSQQLFAKVRHCDSGVSHPRKQHRDLTSLIWSPAHYLLDQCKLSAGNFIRNLAIWRPNVQCDGFRPGGNPGWAKAPYSQARHN